MIIKQLITGITAGLFVGYYVTSLFGFVFLYILNISRKITSFYLVALFIATAVVSIVGGVFLMLPVILAKYYFDYPIDIFKAVFVISILIGALIYNSTHKSHRNKDRLL